MEYFLYLKIKYTSILQNLNEISSIYEEIINNDNINNEIMLENSYIKEMNLYKSQIINVEFLLENIK